MAQTIENRGNNKTDVSSKGQDATSKGMVNGEQELATKMLQIQPKRFYLDVKENRRGRFIKIAEVGAGGRKSRLLMSMSSASDFKAQLGKFAEFNTSLGKEAQSTPDDGLLKSEVMIKENRRYYLDLKENSRGRFLRVTQTWVRGGPRCQIAIPGQGITELRDALSELLDEYGKNEPPPPTDPLPEGKQMRVDNKLFYFDVGQNSRGIFVRVSEVMLKSGYRNSITVPERSWSTFRDFFAEFCEKSKLTGGDHVTSTNTNDEHLVNNHTTDSTQHDHNNNQNQNTHSSHGRRGRRNRRSDHRSSSTAECDQMDTTTDNQDTNRSQNTAGTGTGTDTSSSARRKSQRRTDDKSSSTTAKNGAAKGRGGQKNKPKAAGGVESGHSAENVDPPAVDVVMKENNNSTTNEESDSSNKKDHAVIAGDQSPTATAADGGEGGATSGGSVQLHTSVSPVSSMSSTSPGSNKSDEVGGGGGGATNSAATTSESAKKNE